MVKKKTICTYQTIMKKKIKNYFETILMFRNDKEF
jgi:hypothetical protein